MKISDTTIYMLTRNYATEEVEDGTVNSITFSLGGLYKFARKLITLAQEVGELKFVDTGSRWIASSIFGYYTIVPTGFEYDVFYSEYVPDGVHVTKLRTIEGMSNAMEAAQQDYAKRVLSCLVNGGV